jgi:hypothetical protein
MINLNKQNNKKNNDTNPTKEKYKQLLEIYATR